MTVPVDAADPLATAPCPMCGAEIAGDAIDCIACGERLRGSGTAKRETADKLLRLHAECRGLAMFWCLFGTLSLSWGENSILDLNALGLARLSPGITLTAGLVWLGAGIGAAYRRVPALALGLAVSYAAAGHLFIVGNVTALVIALWIAVFILQGHRALKLAYDLKTSELVAGRKP